MTRILLWSLYFAPGSTNLKETLILFNLPPRAMYFECFNLIDDIIDKNPDDNSDRNDYQGFHTNL